MTIKQFFLEGVDFLRQIYLNRVLIVDLTKRDFKIKYTKNYLGLTWAILEPLAMLLILWFVFSFIRQFQHDKYSFMAYLLSGLIAYDFFNKSLNQGTRSIKAYSFLIKQVNFRLAVLPIINILSELIVHFIVLAIAIVIFLIEGVQPSFYWLQVFYYIFASCVLLIGITWMTASIVLFVWDIFYVISITMRLLFFLTPIFWTPDSLTPLMALILKINPLYHIVEGYRMSFIYYQPFWSDMYSLVTFWIITAMFFLSGLFVFKRLRPHFADVV